MLKKVLKCFLAVILLVTGFPEAKAMEKSIQSLNDNEAITNSGARKEITYEDQQAFVYYGSSGINIVTESNTLHIPTNFGVLKLEVAGDVNKDGYADFITYQNAPDFAAQLMTVSGKDGQVISSLQFTRESYSDSYGFFQTNSYIQQMLPMGDGTCLFVYDYNLARANLSTGEIMFTYTSDDNLWKAVLVDDVNGLGEKDVACSGQRNTIVIVSGEDGSEISVHHPAGEYTVSMRWNEERTSTAVMNIWDLYYENGILYALSEDGYLIKMDPSYIPAENEEVTFDKYSLGIVSEELFNNQLQDQMEWFRNSVSYRITGIARANYMGYRFADVSEGYFLIDCFMGDLNSAAQYRNGNFTAVTAVYDRSTDEVISSHVLDFMSDRYIKSCFGIYNEEPCVASVTSKADKSVRIGLYALSGEMVNQKELETALAKGDMQSLELSWADDRYILQIFNSGCLYISADLKENQYCYDSVGSSLLEVSDDSALVVFSNNGIKDRIVKFASNLTDVIWEYKLNANYSNKGFEYITTDYDFNKDGINDVILLVNRYNKDGYAEATYYIIIDSNGNVHRNNCVVTSSYWEGGVKKTTYLTAQQISLGNDYDGDGTKELLMDGSVIGSRKNQVIGSLEGYLDAKGTPLEIGDFNRDGVKDYVVFNGSEARLYQSRVRYSYGYVSVDYTKTGTTRWIDTSLDPLNTSVILPDMNNDGAKEIGMIGRNDDGHEIYIIVNGKTLKDLTTLYKEGVRDVGEGIAVLPYDLNGDGINELAGRKMWNPWIVDGATGEFLVNTAIHQDDGYYYEENYYPDYLVPFYQMDQAEFSFIRINDVNGDGKSEVAFPVIKYDRESYQELSNIMVYSGADMSVVTEIPFVYDYNKPIGTVYNVANSDRYFIMGSESEASVVDMKTSSILATYDLKIKKAYQFGENMIFAEAEDGQLYSLDTQKSFTLTSQVPETTADYQQTFSWDGIQDYSIMTITDNGSVVYNGQDSQATISFVEGDHNIVLSMNDGLGKTYKETYRMTVEPQPASYVTEFVIAAVLLLVALIFGVFQKIWFNRKFKKEVSGK